MIEDTADRLLITQAILRLEELGDIDLAIRLADHFKLKCWEEDEAKVSEQERLNEAISRARGLRF